MQKPSLWQAFSAYLIDIIGVKGVIILPIIIVAMLVTGIALHNKFVWETVGSVLFALYFALLERNSGASWGKRCMKIKIMPRGEKNPSFQRVSAAYLIDEILAIFFALIATYISARLLNFPLRVVVTIFPGLPKVFLGIMGIGIFLFWYSFYYAYSEHKWGYSVGKQLMGLQVVQKEN